MQSHSLSHSHSQHVADSIPSQCPCCSLHVVINMITGMYLKCSKHCARVACCRFHSISVSSLSLSLSPPHCQLRSQNLHFHILICVHMHCFNCMAIGLDSKCMAPLLVCLSKCNQIGVEPLKFFPFRFKQSIHLVCDILHLTRKHRFPPAIMPLKKHLKHTHTLLTILIDLVVMFLRGKGKKGVKHNHCYFEQKQLNIHNVCHCRSCSLF